MSPDGTVWASKFEWEVYDALSRHRGAFVRKCTGSDTISYIEPRPNVTCVACGSSECVQARTYTPDIFYIPKAAAPNGGGYFIEAKGYFRAEKRMLFRHLVNSNPDYDLRVVLSANNWVTKGKTRISDYFDRYMKDTPYHIWDGDIPEDWK